MGAMDEVESAALLARSKVAYRDKRFDEAENLARQALATAERASGAESEAIVQYLSWLAIALGGTQARNKTALPEQVLLHERVLRIVESTKGPRDLSTAEALHALALGLHRLGRHDDALAALRRALDISDGTLLGDSYYLTTWAVLEALGTLLLEMGRAEEAIPFLHRVVQRTDAQANDTGLSLSRMVLHRKLGRALLNARRADEAVPSLRTALAIAEAKGEEVAAGELRAWLAEAQG